jgi:parallel beta-helix repeat protein
MANIVDKNTNQVVAVQSLAFLVVGFADADYKVTGATDDVKIQQALDKIKTLGKGKLFFKKGTYDIVSNLRYPSNIEIECEQGVVFKLHSGFANYSCFRHDANNQSNVTFKNVTIDLNQQVGKAGIWAGIASRINIEDCYIYNSVPVVGTAGAGVDFDYITDSIITNTKALNMSAHGIALKHCSEIDVTDCDSQGSDDRGILVDPDCEYIRIKGGNYSYNNFNGVHINHGSRHCSVIGVTANYNGISGIAVQSATSDPIPFQGYRCLIMGNLCRGNTENGIVLSDNFDDTITGNICLENIQHGIRCRTMRECTLSANICQKNTIRGIVLETGCFNNTVSNNILRFNKADGIQVRATSSRNTLTGNICGNNGWGSVGNRDGILVTDDGTGTYPTRNTITANICYDDQTADTTTLSSNVSAGTRILTVVSTDTFAVDRPITIADGVNTENHVIESIDSRTQMTLVSNLANSFLAATPTTIVGRATQRYGINIANALCTNHTISSNQTYGNLTGDIRNLDTKGYLIGNVDNTGGQNTTMNQRILLNVYEDKVGVKVVKDVAGGAATSYPMYIQLGSADPANAAILAESLGNRSALRIVKSGAGGGNAIDIPTNSGTGKDIAGVNWGVSHPGIANLLGIDLSDVQAVSTTATVNATATYVSASASGGAFTLTLPAASDRPGRVLVVQKTDNGANVVTVASADLINGAASVTDLGTQWESYILWSSGSTWRIVGGVF